MLEARGTGKAPLAGGYTVLERPNVGLVLSLPVEVVARCAGRGGPSNVLRVAVLSLALGECYRFEAAAAPQSFTQTGGPENLFVHHALSSALATQNGPFAVAEAVFEVRSDARFHGAAAAPQHSVPLDDDSDDALFARVEAAAALPHGTQRRGAKTGLGSSAALTAALVKGALALTGGGADGHAVAQEAHCAAQGKVGSGFDVCAAFVGSARYVRFSPALLGKGPLDMLVDARELLPLARCCVVVGAVPGDGSHTPSMVRKIMEWRAANAARWAELCAANAAIDAACSGFCALEAAEVETAANTLSATWEGPAALVRLRDSFAEMRRLWRIIGRESGCDLEPQSQTRRLDAVLDRVPGVVAAAVPGAGGHDAVFAIVLGRDDSACRAVWAEMGVRHLVTV